jgi:ParB family chromosome partitioning protein
VAPACCIPFGFGGARMSGRRGGLGRGLDSLLPSGGVERRSDTPGLTAASLDAIVPNRRQPRKTFDDDEARDLATSIAELGLLQPLLVRPLGPGRYELIAGERRWRAARVAGLEQVPILIVETDDSGSLERALVENIHRADLNPIEEAAGYRQLMDEAGLTQDQLGAKIGRDRTTISNSTRLLDLPGAVQRLIVEGRLSAGHGRALLGLNGNPFQERLAVRMAHEGMSVRAAEDLVKRYRDMLPDALGGEPRSRPQRDEGVIEAERLISGRLGARVSVIPGKRKGKIVIEYSSPDELKRLSSEIARGPRP